MNEQDCIRVITVDDHELMRGGIKFILLAFDDLELVGEARNGQEALQVCGELSPDVVLMDMRMANMDGIATTRALRAAYPRIQVVMLTSFHDQQLVHQAIQAGAVGYLLKDASKEEIADAIRRAYGGHATFSIEAASDLAGCSPTPLGHDLTEREREVLVLLSKGLSNKQIGKQLHRSPFTVRHHVSRIISKLGAANRSEAAALAVQHRLVD